MNSSLSQTLPASIPAGTVPPAGTVCRLEAAMAWAQEGDGAAPGQVPAVTEPQMCP